MDKELVKAFVLECKQEQEWKERWEANHIEFDNYFKDSGKVEPHKVLISHWSYKDNENNLREHFINTKEYEKLWKDKAGKNYPGRFSAEIEAFYWNEAENSLRSD